MRVHEPEPVNGHGHSHGLVDRSILRSRAGVRAVFWAPLILGVTAAAQALVFILSDSVALLADLIHNAGDAATAIPLGIAFALRNARAERIAGLFVVLAIFVSACVAGYEAILRLISPTSQRISERSRSPAFSASSGIGSPGSFGRAPAAGCGARLSLPTAHMRAPTPTSAWP